MKKKIICIVQARLNSTRLPGKVLLDLGGKSVLERVVERARRSKLIDDIIVATTTRSEDLKIVRLCSGKGIRIFCGSENDVLDRYFQAARLAGAFHVVRITADCPLIDPGIIDRVIRMHLAKKSDYTSNVLKATYPDGEDVEVFSFKALKFAWENARLASEREHVTTFIQNNPLLFKLVGVTYKKDISGKRWTLDERRDYKLIQSIYGYFSGREETFTMEDVLRIIGRHPGLERINSGIGRNEGYFKFLKDDKVLALRQRGRHG